MATEFNTGGDGSLNEAVKSRYEANTDTNAFTDAEKSKLAAIPANAEANAVDSVNGATGNVVLDADDINDDASAHKFATGAQLAKIDSVETGATADQSGAEIVSAIDAELGGATWQSGGGGGSTVDVVSNVAQGRILGRTSTGNGDSEELTAANVRAFLNVENGATADQSGAEIVSAIDAELGGATWQSGGGGGGTVDVVSNVAQGRILGRTSGGSGNSEELTANDVRSFLNVENGASADQSGVEIKALYEAESDTNAFSDAEKSKLAGVSPGATANSGALADADTVGTAEIDNGAVTLTKIEQISTNRLLGRTSGGTGEVEVLSAGAVRAILNVMTSATLSSNADGSGAALVGIADAGAFTSETDVEGALQEIYGVLDNHGDIVTQDISNFVRKSEREVIVFDAGGSHTVPRPTQASDKTVIWFNHGSQLPDNMGAFDIATGQGFGVANVKTQTGASYTPVIGDVGFNIDMDNASSNTVTIPTNATVAFEVGSVISITQLGAGATTVAGDAGVTVNGTTAGSVTINNRYSGVVLRKVATNEWVAQGDIS
ncbi:hypothetical protein [uncultured Roseovarius sp.]|uniref:hypothetical protein n=1 Tax=uncultured Roseovarius sp. TaxID=293344 RepID=UPI00262395AD|nr:hypothetical protein [uncultured Roseovarius sp.]